MTTCGCKPGSFDTGWHEVRSDACRAHELKVWSDMMERSQGIGSLVVRYAGRTLLNP